MMKKAVRSYSVMLFCIWICFGVCLGNVMMIGNNSTLSFDDIEATFAPAVKGSGKSGKLYVAEPLDACSPLANMVDPSAKGTRSPFLLIIRGRCSFEDKVRRAQDAGFKAAIIYDYADGGLVAMAGDAAGIKIHAVFVSKASGKILIKHIGVSNMEMWILPSFGNSTWSIMALSLISLLSMSAVLATCFFVREHQVRRGRPLGTNRRVAQGMSSRLVKAMPSLKFTAVVEEDSTSATCAICLEDYEVGDELRILPCHHKFHASCVDAWLTTWRTFCPVCKRDAKTSMGQPPASEHTPLLSSGPPSFASSSSVPPSTRSSLVSSSAIHIVPSSCRSPSGAYIYPVSVSQSLCPSSPPGTHIHSISSTPYMHHSLRSSYRQSPSLSVSRSSVDLRNPYSQRSPSHSVSPYPVAYPSVSLLNSRYRSQHMPIPMNASNHVESSYVGSSRRQQNLLHFSESASSFSPFNSAQSLPGC